MQTIAAGGHGWLPAASTQHTEAFEIAKQCLKDLNISDNPSRIAAQGDDLVPVQVMLIDSSTRKVHVAQSASLAELAEKISEQLKICRFKDFSFYELTDGTLEGPHKLLLDRTAVSSLIIAGFTYGKTNLLYKRRFLLSSEQLNPSDLTHATLTYRQALFEYLHYPVCENPAFVCQIAATIIYLESDHYSSYIAGDKLKKHDLLEQIMPKCMVPESHRGKKEKILSWVGLGSSENKQRAKYAQQLSNEYVKLKIVLDKNEPRLLQMSRVMSMMQECWLFGTQYWTGRLLPEVPQGRVPLPDLETRSFCAFDFEYLICVDIWGLRFIAGEPAAHVQWAFMFVPESSLRVVQWEEKDNIIQFIVQLAEEPDVNFSLFVECKQAQEVMYAMDVASRDGRSLSRDRAFSRVDTGSSVAWGAAAAAKLDEPTGEASAPEDDEAMKMIKALKGTGDEDFDDGFEDDFEKQLALDKARTEANDKAEASAADVAPTSSAKLYHVSKDGSETKTAEVPVTRDSLNQRDAFVLDAGSKIYIWCGESCSPFEKNAANTLAEQKEAEPERCGDSKATHDIDDAFWALLGGEGPIEA